MYRECAGNFLNVQEFQAKRKKFPAQLGHVQEEYEEALFFLHMSKISGILPIHFPIIIIIDMQIYDGTDMQTFDGTDRQIYASLLYSVNQTQTFSLNHS